VFSLLKTDGLTVIYRRYFLMKHIKYILLLFLGPTLIGCNLNTQKKIDTETAMELSKEAGSLMGKALQIEFSDSLQASILYRQALDKFLEATKSDTTHKEFALYLPDLYGKLNKMDSSAYWKNKLALDK
jgi:hypothetical protein